MSVFENEGNVSQDANFRAHLDSNWESGNREFDKVEGLLNTLEENFNNSRDEIHQLQESFNNLKEQHTKDNETIEKQDERITKLEKAVFEAQYINDTDDVADHDKSVALQDINDTNVVDDDDGLIIEQDNYKSLPSDIN